MAAPGIPLEFCDYCWKVLFGLSSIKRKRHLKCCKQEAALRRLMKWNTTSKFIEAGYLRAGEPYA